MSKLTAFLLAIALFLFSVASGAQAQTIIITVRLPAYVSESIARPILDEFEAAYPGTRTIQVESPPENFVTITDAQNHLDTSEHYVSSADVVFVDTRNMTELSVRAGHYLDLSPLINADTSLHAEDYFSAAWESFQWDGGSWALPMAFDAVILVFDALAFDAANLPYPNENWTMDDFALAARALTQRNAAGEIIAPGLYTTLGIYDSLFLQTLLGHPFLDDTVIPAIPRFDDPQLEDLLTTWAELRREGVVGLGDSSASVGLDDIDSPMRLYLTTFIHSSDLGDTVVLTPSLLPGGKAGIYVNGFAVSAGTAYPDTAYTLTKFLSTHPQLISALTTVRPARVDLLNPGTTYPANLSPESFAVIDAAFDHTIPLSQMRFQGFVDSALDDMVANNTDTRTALQNATQNANATLQLADEHRTRSIVVVSAETPVPESAVNLRFAVATSFTTIDLAPWKRIADEFASADPQVDSVTIKQVGYTDEVGEALLTNYDCFYENRRLTIFTEEEVLALDPLLQSDPGFDMNDFIGGQRTFDAISVNGYLQSYPVHLVPRVIYYDPARLTTAGIPLPINGWTVNQFLEALQRLHELEPNRPPFYTYSFGSNHLLQLITVFGGSPIDFYGQPPHANFTEPNNVEAIRQVLDLGKTGLMRYEQIGMFGFPTQSGRPPIYADTYGLERVNLDRAEPAPPYSVTTYPRGVYNSASYEVGVAYISAQTLQPEACYRFIKEIARNPHLFGEMPARYSLLDDPLTQASIDESTLTFYRNFALLIRESNTIIVPPFAGWQGFFYSFWLTQAADRYVFEDADLEISLADAMLKIEAFDACVNRLPVDQQQSAEMDYCAAGVDEALAFFGPPE